MKPRKINDVWNFGLFLNQKITLPEFLKRGNQLKKKKPQKLEALKSQLNNVPEISTKKVVTFDQEVKEPVIQKK